MEYFKLRAVAIMFIFMLEVLPTVGMLFPPRIDPSRLPHFLCFAASLYLVVRIWRVPPVPEEPLAIPDDIFEQDKKVIQHYRREVLRRRHRADVARAANTLPWVILLIVVMILDFSLMRLFDSYSEVDAFSCWEFLRDISIL